MNLEEELRKTWELYELGVPLYMRGGQIEVDDPFAVSPEDAAAQLQGMQEPYVPTGPASPGEPTKFDKVMKALPETTIGQIVGEVVDAITLPGDVYQGNIPVNTPDPATGEVRTNPEVIDRAGNFALTVGAGGVGGPQSIPGDTVEKAAKAGRRMRRAPKAPEV